MEFVLMNYYISCILQIYSLFSLSKGGKQYCAKLNDTVVALKRNDTISLWSY